MHFGIGERLGLLSILPERGTLDTRRVVRDFQREVGFDEEEHKAAGITNESDVYKWNPGHPTKDIEVGDVLRGVLLKELEAVSEKEQITDLLLGLYEKLSAEEPHD